MSPRKMSHVGPPGITYSKEELEKVFLTEKNDLSPNDRPRKKERVIRPQSKRYFRPTTIKINLPENPFVIGQEIQMTVNALNLRDKPVPHRLTVTWNSENVDVATITEDGLLTPISNGFTRITATCDEISSTTNELIAVCPDYLIKENGKYSQAYQGDWATLGTGKDLATWEDGSYTLVDVNGSTVKQSYANQEYIEIKGLRLNVTWSNAYTKYGNLLYLFQKCENILIEDCVIHIANAESNDVQRSSSIFHFENCGNIIIRNCRIAGACRGSAIRIEGCETHFIDKVEFSGLLYNTGTLVGGPAIEVSGGSGWDPVTQKPTANYFATGYRCPRWGVIQNCYIHDHNPPTSLNNDGILTMSPGNHLTFNCYFENWGNTLGYADGAIDAGHRRYDYENYGPNKIQRIERCVFDNCSHTKTSGSSAPNIGHQVVWCNNVHINSFVSDYHGNPYLWRIHETFLFSSQKSWFFELQFGGSDPYPFFIRNCIVYSTVQVGNIYSFQSSSKAHGASDLMPDYILYVFPSIRSDRDWRDTRTSELVISTIVSWSDWLLAGYDQHSTWQTEGTPGFSIENWMNGPSIGSSADGAGTPETLFEETQRVSVTRDFMGRTRPYPPSMGAFEVQN